MSISVVIANHNGGPLLAACLDSVRRLLPEAEVLVIDNASDDNSREATRRDFPDVRLVELSENRGFASANNLGCVESRGDILILLNSDAELLEPGLAACIERLEREPTLAAVSPRLIGTDGLPQPNCLPGPSMGRALRRVFLWEPREGSVDPRRAVVWLPATCLVVRRDALESVGGLFDERFYQYWEDADLCARLIRQGWLLSVCDDSTVLHHGRASDLGPRSISSPQRLLWYAWGRLQWFRKHRTRFEYLLILGIDVLFAGRLFVRSLFGERHRVERARASAILQAVRLTMRNESPPVRTGDGSR
ncbi:glycosyltransferase family 2 protein [Planctomyces sp. SH-PL14]|uniref:glycosyltransferase family 2 protein n=1 Tax=Planctomyces sp. SH-PL14 TaxID=1632864 RepID=UPI0018D2A3D4|nr:glycosyltransferase family 2 protein [Planctomyces sp. SH-PL14]